MKNANPVWWCVLLLGALVTLPLTGCGDNAADRPATNKSVKDYFPIKVDGRAVQMQLAVHVPEMQRGLMERRDLGENQGMLFVYTKPTRMNFFMRNTPTPLDIGFFDRTGTLREVYPMYPFDERTVSSRSDSIQFALEMNQGWFKSHGVRSGAKLDLKALAAALKERGFEPEMFGLEAPK